jgi:hypothetical protein
MEVKIHAILTSNYIEVGGQLRAPAALLSRKYCIGGWLNPTASLDAVKDK